MPVGVLRVARVPMEHTWGCPPAPQPALPRRGVPVGSEPQHAAASHPHNDRALSDQHLTRNADGIIKIPICFRKGF